MYPKYENANSYNISEDISVRDVVNAIIDGTDGEAGRGYYAVLQSVLRDEKGKPVSSEYTYKLTKEGKYHNRGPATTRTGYLCNEHLIKIIDKPASGSTRYDESGSPIGPLMPLRDIVYIVTDLEIKEHDVLVKIKLDREGNIINPVTIDKELNIIQAYPKRLDNGRIEFYMCIVEDQQ